MKLDEIRKNFLGFFQDKSHQVLRSSSLIPQNDPSLLFTNSGMVQFKRFFTGEERPSFPRIVTSQKSLRAGGKHNDLDNVGYTARHLTFFEMLGNFSFGDYFKEQAIEMAWEYITKILQLNREKLFITVYHEDLEARDIWKKITNFSDEKIISIYNNDNFWSMGDTGPCGPCSEIFYDLGEDVPGGPPGSANQDGDRFIEFWNLVFMQYEIMPDGSRINLPKPSIDTGMGLERISAIMQNVKSNFHIDLFVDFIKKIEDITKIKKNSENESSFNVIADHLRSSSFLIADGVLPSNEGRGYVLRRIIRRAARHIYQLKAGDNLMANLAEYLIDSMGRSYPELVRAGELIKKTLDFEEDKFSETLGKGIKLLEDSSKNLKENDIFSGETAFKLYDTYGFPLDLTRDILRAKKIDVDQNAFDENMEKQKTLAKKSWIGNENLQNIDDLNKILSNFGPTIFKDSFENSAKSKVISLMRDGRETTHIQEGEAFYLITDITPFYGESGGQVGDSGRFFSVNQEVLITDTKKFLGKIYIHHGLMVKGNLKIGDYLSPEIDLSRRRLIEANHSATHLLHFALRKFLGSHVTQKGSIVMAEKLRFDFSHNKALTEGELKQIEEQVNEEIRKNNNSDISEMDIEKALEIGAMALFGEKYEDKVRVVSMGKFKDQSNSIELCGGSHVKQTGEIGFFKIISETSIASGVRRIEAITGKEAEKFVHQQRQILSNIAEKFKSKIEDLPKKIEDIQEEKKALVEELKKYKKKMLDQIAEISEVNNVKLVSRLIEIENSLAREVTEQDRKKYNSAIIVTVSKEKDKVSLIIAVTDDLLEKYDANILVKDNINFINGKNGGGKNNFAQAGGTDFSKASLIISSIKKAI